MTTPTVMVSVYGESRSTMAGRTASNHGGSYCPYPYTRCLPNANLHLPYPACSVAWVRIDTSSIGNETEASFVRAVMDANRVVIVHVSFVGLNVAKSRGKLPRPVGSVGTVMDVIMPM